MAAVTDPSVRLVFCEGHSESLDVALLNRVIPPGKAELRPVGGKYAMRAFIEGHLAGYGPQPDNWPDYLGFRDRDFDTEPPETPELIRLPGEKPIWMTYRACVESYLIDAGLLHDYWVESASGPRWRHGPPPSVDSVERLIPQAARELAEYQAIRWSLARLKPGPRWPEIRTTWTRGSGHLPPALAFDDCMTEAGKLVDDFVAQVRGISRANLEETARTYRLRFAEDSFYSEHQFLVWFHGKDLLVQLSRHLTPNFPRRHYAAWAANYLDLNRHPDLRQLVDLVA